MQEPNSSQFGGFARTPTSRGGFTVAPLWGEEGERRWIKADNG
jgi:hypothetical protein